MSLVSRKYASALMEAALELNQLDDIFNDFKIIQDSFNQNQDFWVLINSPGLQKKQQKQILMDIFGGKTNDALYNFLLILIDKNRFMELKSIFITFKDLYLAEKNTMEAMIVSAVELRDDYKEQLKKNLELKYQKNIILQTSIDPSILGGLIVYVGDQVIDGSSKRKLNNIKNSLKEIRLQQLGVS